MRLTSAFWVSAYIRTCRNETIPAYIVRRGAEAAGAIFIWVNHLDGCGMLYGPAAQSYLNETTDRLFEPCFDDQAVNEADAEARIASEQRFDPDIWLIELESASGRHNLPLAAPEAEKISGLVRPGQKPEMPVRTKAGDESGEDRLPDENDTHASPTRQQALKAAEALFGKKD